MISRGPIPNVIGVLCALGMLLLFTSYPFFKENFGGVMGIPSMIVAFLFGRYGSYFLFFAPSRQVAPTLDIGAVRSMKADITKDEAKVKGQTVVLVKCNLTFSEIEREIIKKHDLRKRVFFEKNTNTPEDWVTAYGKPHGSFRADSYDNEKPRYSITAAIGPMMDIDSHDTGTRTGRCAHLIIPVRSHLEADNLMRELQKAADQFRGELEANNVR